MPYCRIWRAGAAGGSSGAHVFSAASFVALLAPPRVPARDLTLGFLATIQVVEDAQSVDRSALSKEFVTRDCEYATRRRVEHYITGLCFTVELSLVRT